MLHIGTSGFSYRDWVGPFYPYGTPTGGMLGIYAAEFDTVELDYTYYAMPNPKSMAGFVQRTPEGFTFSVRTHKSITHDKYLTDEEASLNARRFAEALLPLAEAGRLGAILVQFPWSFKMNPSSLVRLERIVRSLRGMRVAVEFRNDSWADQAALSQLSGLGAALCCVDEPRIPGLFPPLVAVTADFSYLRFHGRNARDWWSQSPGKDRYDYDYKDGELEEWIPGIHKLEKAAKDTYIYMNNCHMGKAARNARALKKKLISDA